MIPLQFKKFPPNHPSQPSSRPDPLVNLMARVQKTSIQTKLSFLSDRNTDPKSTNDKYTKFSRSIQQTSAFHLKTLSSHNPNLLSLQPSTSKSSYLIPAFITLQKSRRQRKHFVPDNAPAHGKIFLEQNFANFSSRKFGLEFADPRSVSKIGQILPANSSNFFGLAISG